MSGAEREFTLQSSDGTSLRALLASPPRPVGALMLCHGLTTNCEEHGTFPEIRDLALRRGLAVARFDFRAHGDSGGTNEKLTLQGMRADADAVVKLIHGQLGADLPLVVLGVSFGGAAAVHVAATQPRCAGLALWYAVIDYDFNYGARSQVAFTLQMRAAHGEADPDWSAMPVLTTSYHFPRTLCAEFAGDNTSRKLRDLGCPVLAFHGSRDQLVDPAPLHRIASEYGHVKLRRMLGAGHGFILWRPIVVRSTMSFAHRVATRLGASGATRAKCPEIRR